VATIEPTRIRTLCDHDPDDGGSYVLYWMQQAQRAEHNPALEHAIDLADERGQPLLVGFGLYEDYPEANERSFAFMLEGLAETAAALAERGIKLVLRRGRPDRVALELADDASLVVCDRGYLRHQRQWRRAVAEAVGRYMVQVETDVVVPVDEASDKSEYAARTLRPKIDKRRDEYIRPLRPGRPGKASLPLRVPGDCDATKAERILDELRIDREVGRVRHFRGGTAAARRRLTGFLRRAAGYAEARNDPADPSTSALSPYLHFGHISPVEIAHKIESASGPSRADKDTFLEELIVRRELAVNFVEFEEHYDSYRCLPAWARKTLAKHENDERPHRYTAAQLENAETHDPYWNAAMNEMRVTGYMHNYMRMYWGKKILEWSDTPEQAYRTTLAINNRWFLDGRDPASYANVAWIFGLHDRPWQERPIFGTVRYMAASGLERKFDIDGYVRRVEELPEE
jgi:deoxyribodipyrimidine photo-lyase